MRGRWFRSRLAQGLAVVVSCVAALVIYFGVATDRARQKAEAFCHAVPVGTSVEVAKTLIDAADTEPGLRGAHEGNLFVGFRGAFLDRYFCDLELAEGHVVGNRINFLD